MIQIIIHTVQTQFGIKLDCAERDLTIGEEVSHFLHFVVNPNAFRRKGMSVHTAIYAIECVGHYGGIIYSTQNGCQFSYRFYEDLMLELTGDNDTSMRSFLHQEAYRRAANLFARFGDTKLYDLSRMDFEALNEEFPFVTRIDEYEKNTLRIFCVTPYLYAGKKLW